MRKLSGDSRLSNPSLHVDQADCDCHPEKSLTSSDTLVNTLRGKWSSQTPAIPTAIMREARRRTISGARFLKQDSQQPLHLSRAP